MAASTIPGLALDDSVYQRLLAQRIVFLGAEVDAAIANSISAQMLLLAADDPERDVFLYINSPGGSVDAGMAIYDTMHYIEPQVGTVVLGMAASMGQLLLCAGAPGKRFALPHARVLMHQPSGGMGGTAADIAIQAEQLVLMKQQIFELTARHSGQTVERVVADADRDRWFSADQARAYGLVDHVVSSTAEVGAGALLGAPAPAPAATASQTPGSGDGDPG